MAYQRGNVIVDEHFVRFGSKSYALNKINSVDVKHERKERNGWLFLGLLGAILALAGIAGERNFGLLFVAAVLLGIAYLMFRKRTTDTYHLMFATSSGEAQATSTQDRDAIDELRRVIEEAIVSRG